MLDVGTGTFSASTFNADGFWTVDPCWPKAGAVEDEMGSGSIAGANG